MRQHLAGQAVAGIELWYDARMETKKYRTTIAKGVVRLRVGDGKSGVRKPAYVFS
jgi:hypothetical protein